MSYKEILDDYFGHGSARVIHDKRLAIVLSAHARQERISTWFPNPDERDFFISCMNLILKQYGTEEDEANRTTPVGDISDAIAPWDPADDESDSSLSPDEDANDTSGTYKSIKATKAVRTPIARLHSRPPVITHESVTSLLIGSIKKLK